MIFRQARRGNIAPRKAFSPLDPALMNLQCRVEIALAYKAASQVARVLSEDWCTRQLYCAACDSSRLSPSKTNTPAIDFVCPKCEQPFQLKSFRAWNQKKIVDAGYQSMLRAIRADKVPNLLVLQYSPQWLVENLLLIPGIFFSASAIEKRAPLSPTARRAGWVGCNILLNRISEDGKISVVSNGSAIAKEQVRAEFSRVRKLAEVPPTLRGWTLDILNLIRKLGKTHFSLEELYRFEPELKAIHPHNQNVRPKIRQQLQVLRDFGFVKFMGSGTYAVSATSF
jgi:type II restriction enzyme